MAKNYMEEIAAMLGVELGERFKIESSGMTYHLSEDGLIASNGHVYSNVLNNIVTGKNAIVKKPWKPKNGDKYWYICADGELVEAACSYSEGNSYDLAMLYMGNCFRSREDAEAHRDKILAKYKEAIEWTD